ncbi:hypothetical protein LOD99_12618 [Oopsacas minuta]|uniref:C2H2-type domain-containing protein n=1 Tax=Oopsacas minuta TaxID=111878 RepID=A0AAV7JCK6_9METZ|nr:hypothetical protein LOD99_12618 [Oopsacas minuta]
MTSSPSEFLVDLSELPDSDDGILSQLNNSTSNHINTFPCVIDPPIPTSHNEPIQSDTNSIENSTIQNNDSVSDNSQVNITTDLVGLVVNTIPTTTEHFVTSSPDVTDNPGITDVVHTSNEHEQFQPSINPLLNCLNTISNSTNTLTDCLINPLDKTINTSHIKRKLTKTRRKDSKRLKSNPPSVVIRQIGHELFEDSFSPVKLPPTFILPNNSNLIQSKLSLSRTKKNIPIDIEISYLSDINSQDDTNIQCVDNLDDINTSNTLPSSSKEIPVSDSNIDIIPSSPLDLQFESDKDEDTVLPHAQQISRDDINQMTPLSNPKETGNDIPTDSTVTPQKVESKNTQEYLSNFAIALGENPDFFNQDKLKSNLISPRKKPKLHKKKCKVQIAYKQKLKHKPNRLKSRVRTKIRSRRVIGSVMVKAVLKDKVTLPSITGKRYVRHVTDIPFDTRGRSTSPENSDIDMNTRKQQTIAHVKKRYHNLYKTIYPQMRAEEITQPPIKGNTDYAKPQPGVQLSLKETLIYARQERRNFACHNCLLCFETPYQLLQHSMLSKCDEIPTYYPEY